MKPSRAMLIFCAFLAQTVLNSAQSYAQGAPRPAAAAAVTPQDAEVKRFYGLHGQRPFWNEADWNIAAGFLQNADREGLEPERYRVPERSDPLARDMARTAMVLSYMRDLRLGRLRARDRDVALPEPAFDAPAALLAAQGPDRIKALLAALPPPAAEYRQLRLALIRYRALAAAGGWPKLQPAESPENVQQRLETEYPSLRGAELQSGLKQFQQWHGLSADGVLSRATLAALNVSADERARQIQANMERWRWLPRPLEASRLMVNVPAAMLELVTEEKTVLTSRVIVGKPATPTPILRADGIAVTVNPPWTVPHSIAVKEMLPKLKRDAGYLKSQNIVLLNGPPGDPHGLSVNWRALPAGTFPYRLQQLPGPDNALGLIKLELPNRFDVYLHDTPGRAAFAAAQRALSHGCVRVQQILPLAAWALSPDEREAATRITEAVAAGETRTLPLPRAIPVYFLYWTAAADAAGEVRFWSDIYGRDRRIMQPWQAPATALRLASQAAKCPAG